MMAVRLLQEENTDTPKFTTLFGIVTHIRLVQPKNAKSMILTIPDGISILVKLVQF